MLKGVLYKRVDIIIASYESTEGEFIPHVAINGE